MFSRLLSNYDVIVDRFIVPGVSFGCVAGSLTGSYTFTDPRQGDVRIRDAIFGSIVGGAMGGIIGGVSILAHPVLWLSPLALGPYAYNKYKMESETRKTETLS
jgi:branched-subunit amino acid ABC-type transport system permease component